MEYEDDELAAPAVEKASAKKETPPVETRQKKDQGSHRREPRATGPRFTNHTPVNTPIDNILAECTSRGNGPTKRNIIVITVVVATPLISVSL